MDRLRQRAGNLINAILIMAGLSAAAGSCLEGGVERTLIAGEAAAPEGSDDAQKPTRPAQTAPPRQVEYATVLPPEGGCWVVCKSPYRETKIPRIKCVSKGEIVPLPKEQVFPGIEAAYDYWMDSYLDPDAQEFEDCPPY